VKNLPRKALPDNYSLSWKFDLTRVRELFWLNFFALTIFFLSIFVFGFLIFLFRPEVIPVNYHYHPPTLGQAASFLAKVFGVMLLMVPLHEGFHGLFFWLFTKTQPKYTFKIYYAAASAPGWFFPRWQYFFISLAPFVGITALGLLGISYLPANFILPFYFLLLLNSTGSVGDLWVVLKLLFHNSDTLIRDFGDAIEFYMPITGERS